MNGPWYLTLGLHVSPDMEIPQHVADAAFRVAISEERPVRESDVLLCYAIHLLHSVPGLSVVTATAEQRPLSQAHTIEVGDHS